ncbi:MAG: hypothetical protein SVX43_10880, partial [Cyanobacteriota bacterium]|nr:hypothetical protein [Cyanobacteriota bacterium]
VLGISLTFIFGFPSAPLSASEEEDWRSLFEMQLQRSYQRAIQDADDAQRSEISNTLWPITPDNPNLRWREVNGQPQVLVVTWTSWNGYRDRVGQTMQLSREVWVTAVPELQQFAAQLNFDPESLTLRLEQYLGLPPHNGKTQFVQMWVDPQDLFRPCPDPEIIDTRCEVQFPETVARSHQMWFIELLLSSYNPQGYPWTRLGYTYDWGRIETEVGASEFILREGAEVEIESVVETIEYIR